MSTRKAVKRGKAKATKRGKVKNAKAQGLRLSDYFRQQRAGNVEADDATTIGTACADGTKAFKWLRVQEDKGRTATQILETARTAKSGTLLKRWYESYILDNVDDSNERYQEREELYNEISTEIDDVNELIDQLDNLSVDRIGSKLINTTRTAFQAKLRELEALRDKNDPDNYDENARIELVHKGTRLVLQYVQE